MLDANLDVPGIVALADEIVALLVHTTLVDHLDLHVEKSHNVPSCIISFGVLLEVFFTQHFFSCLCLIRQFFSFPKSLQLLI